MSCGLGKAAEGWTMSCDVGEVTERLENELGEAREGLENEL